MVVFLRSGVDARRPSDLNLNAVIEGANLKSCVEIQRNTGDAAFTGWNINLNGIQPDDQVFLDDNTTGTTTLLGARIEVDTISTTPTNGLFFPAAKWRGQGQMFMRPFSGLSNLPGLWIGEIAVQDPDAWVWPAGSYEVQSVTLAAAVQQRRYVKGETRFISAAASTIAAGDFDTAGFVSITGSRIQAPHIFTFTAELADDTATSFVVPFVAPAFIPSVIAIIGSNGGSNVNGVYYIRASASPTAVALTSGGTPASVTTGVLTGTTGADGVFTLSGANNGNAYFENRTGATRQISVTFVSVV
jgi:hypothetical protein